RVKRTELDQAKVFVGTCPDMCPEKERYMRETRNQLSVYELLPGTDKLDHAAAIKEYSRSSADQEEPLPHELRPTSVLSMTMDYLVTWIMDQGDGNYREWYDFVWNRTRGIRKDITQQHLCDLASVSLMEKCMRFHIHCAHQLCEEPMSSFDTKINNENLTKCLQSLKEMYQDLQNRGVYCPCEPEFRGYSVLLSLNKGDILREVQQFRPSVRNSAEVKFAVQVFAALNSTNFVRFFKLIRSASYLNSCILHCYFNQIRRDALRALNVAYTASTQRSTSFPLDNMVRLLLFQDTDEATDFLTSYGLSVSDGYVELSRTAYLEPEVPANPRKCALISQKRQVSVGGVVNGAPLPQFTLHIPVCSFDAQNKYTGGSITAEPREGHKAPADTPDMRDFEPEELTFKQTLVRLQDTKEVSSFQVQSAFQPIMRPEKPPSPARPTYGDEDVFAVMEDIVDDLVKEHSGELSRNGAAFISKALEVSSSLADMLVTDLVLEISHKVAGEEVRAETKRVEEEVRRKAEDAKLKQQREQLLRLLCESYCQELMTEVLSESIYQVSSAELQQAAQLAHKARITRCSQDVCGQWINRFLEEEMDQMATESLHEMQCCLKYLQRWREVLASRKKLRRQMRGFPAAPGSVGCDDKLKALIPSAPETVHQSVAKGILDMGHAGKLGVSFTRFQKLREQMFHEMKVQHFYQQLLCEAAWAPLELPSLIAQSLPSWKQCVFWKLLLVLPESAEHSSILSEWLKTKFCGQNDPTVDDPEQPVQTLALYSCLESHEGRAVGVNVCIKVVQGPLTSLEVEQAETQKKLLGTSGCVLLLPPREDETEEDVYWLMAELQLKQLLQAKPFLPPPPLAVLVPWQCQDAEVEEGLHLPDLISGGLISDYVLIPIPDSVNDMQGTNGVSSAVRFLLSRCPGAMELCSLPLQQYIEDGVCRFFSEPFHTDMWERRKAGLPSQDPAAIIDLYNDTLRFLAVAVSSQHLLDLSWPVIEFASPQGSSVLPFVGWNCPGHLAWLKKAVLSFQIPQMDIPPPDAPWRPVCSMIQEYVCQICASPRALPVLLSEVQCLLGRTYKRWREKQNGTNMEGPAVQDIPWDDLLTLCINHKLRDWDPPRTTQATGCPDGTTSVYFMQEDLKNFIPPKTWRRAQLSLHQDVRQDASSPGRRRRSAQKLRILDPGSLTLEERSEIQIPSTEPSDALSERLKHSLQAEREESRLFEERLEHLLSDVPLDDATSLSLPMYIPESLLGDLDTLHNLTTHTVHSPSIRASSAHSAACTPSPQESLSDNIHKLYIHLKETRQKDAAYDLHLKTLLEMGGQ
ncbi:germinal-center associated nuclear protein, partial [Discoglossus pictus]